MRIKYLENTTERVKAVPWPNYSSYCSLQTLTAKELYKESSYLNGSINYNEPYSRIACCQCQNSCRITQPISNDTVLLSFNLFHSLVSLYFLQILFALQKLRHGLLGGDFKIVVKASVLLGDPLVDDL